MLVFLWARGGEGQGLGEIGTKELELSLNRLNEVTALRKGK
jgi:hypothetical protein